MGEAGCLRDGKFQNLQVDGATNILNNVNLEGGLSFGGNLETQELNVSNNLTVTSDLEVPGTINNSSTGGIHTIETLAEYSAFTQAAGGQLTQPAGTFIKDIFFVNESELRTGEEAAGTLITTIVHGADTIVVCNDGNETGLLGGNGVWSANTPLPIIKDGMVHTGQFGVVAGQLINNSDISLYVTRSYSDSDRTLNVVIEQSNVAETGNINVIITFMYVNQP